MKFVCNIKGLVDGLLNFRSFLEKFHVQKIDLNLK